jgi:hypothetical protein
MNKESLKVTLEDLKKRLETSEKLWKEGVESRAYIVGYLQGTLKNAISELEANLSKSKK